MAGTRHVHLTLCAPGIAALRIAAETLREIADAERDPHDTYAAMIALEKITELLDGPDAVARQF